MRTPPLLFVVLAAGKGTRMKSKTAKVLHKIAGRTMLGHVLALTQAAEAVSVALVVAPGMEAVEAEARSQVASIEIVEQIEQHGTAHAVLAAADALKRHSGDVIVLYADTPLITLDTIREMQAALDAGAGVAVLGFEATDPAGYGRLIETSDRSSLVAIREHRDATPAERAITFCNSGVVAMRLPNPDAMLREIGNGNAKGEFYLTDIVEIAKAAGHHCSAVRCSEREVLGVNARDQLAAAEDIWQRRARETTMRAGVTMTAPETVWLSFDTVIGSDVTIEPNVYFGPGVTVEDDVEIKANCHFEGAVIGRGARIGPFARLRPGAKLGRDVHVGNFVEVKNVEMADGAKANHLSYLGDGRVGAGANIGAGTIFCNYDGFNKHKTDIGDGAFIGSNSALVAPIRIGAGAYIGSGSVITRDVAAGSLALERSEQEERPGWAEKFRIMMGRRKAKPK